ncbi:MAG: acyl-CoA thioesterase [Deltaproteobacteria bacterium]|nr:acyl-CoA thioesterase [Deltaproteobacteria bacterium]
MSGEATIALRPVRFEDVDAAGLVFFARIIEYTHEAMERFFDGLPARPGGATPGYVDLITKRRIGFPAVHVSADFKAPLRYGDVARIATTVTKIGKTSCTFRYAITRVADGVDVATIEHVVVATNLDTVTKQDLPPDVLALLRERTGA